MTKLTYAIGCSIAFFLFTACSSSKNSGKSASGEILIGQAAVTPPKKTVVTFTNAQIKYAIVLNTVPEKLLNAKLYQCIDNWMGTPYKWGGMDKRGIDCSAFVQMLLDTAYNISIPRTSIEQFFALYIDRFASTKHLSEGDLVFFATFGDNVVSHVGMYLCNGQFINSSSIKGVSLGDLNDPYWKSRYVAAGRVKVNLLSSTKNNK